MCFGTWRPSPSFPETQKKLDNKLFFFDQFRQKILENEQNEPKEIQRFVNTGMTLFSLVGCIDGQTSNLMMSNGKTDMCIFCFSYIFGFKKKSLKLKIKNTRKACTTTPQNKLPRFWVSCSLAKSRKTNIL